MANRRRRITAGLRSTRIGGKPVSYAQWQRGDLAKALLGKKYTPGMTGTPPAAPHPPAAPGAPAPPQGRTGPLPPDPIYDASLNRIAAQRDQQTAALKTQRVGELADYGYNEGPGGSLSFDADNPFSKASLLKRLHDTQRRSVGQSMAAGGQLYAGAYQNAQDLSSRNQLQAQDSLQKSLASFLASNRAATTNAGIDYQTRAEVLGGERAARIDTNPLYEPSIQAPGAAPPKARPKAPKPTKPKLTPARAAAAQRRAAARSEARATARARRRARR